MKFGEKLTHLRKERGWTQQELSEKANITRRTITDYENCKRLPKRSETYKILADLFGISVDEIRDDNEDFVTTANEQYGSRGRQQAEMLVHAIGGMYAGGELSDDDMLGVMELMRQHYLRSKEINKKYTPKKYRDDGK